MPLANARDAVFDPSRNLIYLTTDAGKIHRYDLSTGALLAPWNVGTSLRGADITPDGSALYVAEARTTADYKGVVHKVNLATGLWTELTYPRPNGYEEGSFDVAVAADGKAYVTSDFYSSGHSSAIVVIDTATDAITRSTKLHGEYDTVVSRSADRTRLVVGRPHGAVQVFDAATQSVTASGGGSYIPRTNGAPAISGDGAFVVTFGNEFGLAVTTHTGAPVTNLPAGAAIAAFDPMRDRLYVASSDKITAYDTNSWQGLYSIPASTPGGFSSGHMTIDPQGTRLAIVSSTSGANGVQLIDLPTPDGVPATLELTGHPVLALAGQPETFTLTVRDAAGQIATGYRGTVYFASDDLAATVPQPYTFTAQDAGRRTFSLTLRTPGTFRQLTITDPAAALTAKLPLMETNPPAMRQSIGNLGSARAYDASRRLLYISDFYGIRRYDPMTQRMLPIIDLGEMPPTGLDITPDNKYLYVGTSYRSMNHAWLLRVDLDTLALNRIPFALQDNAEVGVQSLVTLANGKVLFNTFKDSNESYGFLREFNPATGVFSVRNDFSIGRLEERSTITRSADHTTAFIAEAFHTDRAVYDSATDRITAFGTHPTAGPLASLSPDGTLIVTGANVHDKNLTFLRTLPGTVVTSAFDPILPRLYAATSGEGVVTYDTNTWQKLFTISAPVYSQIPPSVSDDGRWLFYGGGSAIVIPLFSRPVITSSPSLVAPGATVNVTVQAQGPYGLLDPAYRGTARFSSTDPTAGVPPDTDFTAADAGTKTFPVRFNTPGRRTLTVTDPATGAVSVLADVLVTGVSLDPEGALAIITGDANDTVSVAPDGAGNLAVVVNAAPALLFPAAQVRRLDLVTSGGDDSVTLTGVPGGRADLGAGKDTVNATAGNDLYRPLVIFGGDHDDSATLRAGGPQALDFSAGAGNDAAALHATAANDTITLSGASATVNGASFRAPDAESLRLYAGAGDDTVTGQALRSKTVLTSIDAGDGNDSITISGGGWIDQVYARVTVSGGAGDDSLTVPQGSGALNAYNFLYFLGDAGRDALIFYGDSPDASFYSVTHAAATSGDHSVLHIDVEDITLQGNDRPNTFAVSGGTGLPAVVIHGMGGPDLFNVSSIPHANTAYPTLLGGAGDDQLVTRSDSFGAVRFDAGDGHDTILWNPPASASPATVVAGPAGISAANRQVFADHWEAATLIGSSGADTIRVTPAAAVTFTVAADFPVTSPGDRLILDPVGAAGTTFTPAATGAGAYTFTNRGPVSFTGVETHSILPAVGAVTFDPGAPRRLELPFSVDVGPSLATQDFRLTNRATNTTVAVVFAYDPGFRVAALTFPNFPAGLPDGDYRLHIRAADVTDSANAPMSADFVHDFFALAGDADHDRAVAFPDLVRLAQNYASTQSGGSAQGDFNADGKVDFADLVILAQNYNRILPPPPAPAPAPAPVPAVSLPAAQAPAVAAQRPCSDSQSLFNSTTPVRRPPPPRKAPPTRR